MFFLVERSTKSRVENIFNEPPTGIIFGRRHTFLSKEREKKEDKEKERKALSLFPIILHAVRLHLIVATTWPNKYFSLRHVKECLRLVYNYFCRRYISRTKRIKQ